MLHRVYGTHVKHMQKCVMFLLGIVLLRKYDVKCNTGKVLRVITQRPVMKSVLTQNKFIIYTSCILIRNEKQKVQINIPAVGCLLCFNIIFTRPYSERWYV